MTHQGQIIPADQIEAVLAPLRANHTIVSTNGCFDILHVGHLRYLKQARELGDLLVIALNSDLSVQNLKGPERPIVPEQDRAELLCGLACVDYVVLFDEQTPEPLLHKIRPNIHVKGAQYTLDTLPEAATLKALGAQVAFLEMVAGRSTTDVVEKIKQLALK